jgi:hypothetical protein
VFELPYLDEAEAEGDEDPVSEEEGDHHRKHTWCIPNDAVQK